MKSGKLFLHKLAHSLINIAPFFGLFMFLFWFQATLLNSGTQGLLKSLFSEIISSRLRKPYGKPNGLNSINHIQGKNSPHCTITLAPVLLFFLHRSEWNAWLHMCKDNALGWVPGQTLILQLAGDGITQYTHGWYFRGKLTFEDVGVLDVVRLAVKN